MMMLRIEDIDVKVDRQSNFDVFASKSVQRSWQ